MIAEEVKLAFLFDLNALLQKWDATLSAQNHWHGYAECGEDVRMTAEIPGVWDANGETVREWTDIDLGSYAKAAQAAQAGKDVVVMKYTEHNDTQFRCTVCGQIGTVGRCCGLETREPLNNAARDELAKAAKDVTK